MKRGLARKTLWHVSGPGKEQDHDNLPISAIKTPTYWGHLSGKR